MSIASEVYIRLGLESLEAWTSLRNRYEDIKAAMERAVGPEMDKLLQEIQSVGSALNRIEEDAGIPAGNRSS